MGGQDPNNPGNPWVNQQAGGWQQPTQQQQPVWDAQRQQWVHPGGAVWDAMAQQWIQPAQQHQPAQQQPQQQQWAQQPQQQQWAQQPQQQQWAQQPQAAQAGYQQQQAWNQQQQWNQPQAQASSPSPWQGVAGYGAGAAAATADAIASEPSTGRSIDAAVATLGVNERVTFIKKTYAHLAGAILLFTALEFLFFKVPFVIEKFTVPFTAWAIKSQANWAIVLISFMVAGWVARKWADSATSRGMQYAGLIFYTFVEAVIFVPLIMICMALIPDAGELLAQAGVITLGLFAGLTAVVFVTRKDFSFLKGALTMGCMLALGTIAAAMLFGFSLGIFFSIAMCGLAAIAILYHTSQVLAHYHPQQYVAAALALFAAFALLLWYVIRILMELRR
jgi:FtsH-binding integral membrane protein